MSDEQPDTTPADPTPADATPARARPATPGAAASRRARQLGGPRRPLPHARPTDDDATTEATTTAEPATAKSATAKAGTSSTTARRAPAKPAPAKPATTKPATSKPATTKPGTKSGVGARRPRPTPAAAAVEDAPGSVDETTADTESESESDTTTTTSPARSGRVLVGATALLAVALLAVGVVFLVLTLTAKPAISAAETERALAAAKSDVALVTTYGYQTVDDDAAKAAAVLTGQFRTQYLDSISTVVKPQLPTTQTVTTGQVDTAGLVSADAKGRQVVVLVYGQQSVTNKAQTTPRIDAFQIRVTMQLVDGRWLVAQLDQLGNNA